VGAGLKLLELERAIVHRRGQAEAIIDQVLLARAVAMPHAMELGNGHVRLVDKNQVVAREIIQQRGRRLARQPAGKVARVVFNAMAVAHGLDHLQVEASALMDTLRLDQPPLRLQLLLPHGEFVQDGGDGGLLALRLNHVMRLGINRQTGIFLPHGAEERIDLREGFDLVAEELDAIGHFIVGGIDLDHVAAYAEGPAAEIGCRCARRESPPGAG
jgi:hypothetical protein